MIISCLNIFQSGKSTIKIKIDYPIKLIWTDIIFCNKQNKKIKKIKKIKNKEGFFLSL